MSTRGEIHIYDQYGSQICRIYNQSDSYPAELGLKLMQFLQGKRIVNGISFDDTPQNSSNGMDDLAAQLLTELKREKPLGGVYLYSPFADIEDAQKNVESDIEYIYSITPYHDSVCISVNFGKMMNIVAFEEFIERKLAKQKESIPEKPLGEAVFAVTAMQSFMDDHPGANRDDCLKLAQYMDSLQYLPKSREDAEALGRSFAKVLQGHVSNNFYELRIADFLGITPKQEMR